MKFGESKIFMVKNCHNSSGRHAHYLGSVDIS